MSNKLTLLQLCEKLSGTFGPSGCEDRVTGFIKEYVESFMSAGDEAYIDRLGTLIVKYGKKSTSGDVKQPLLFCTSVDEVGFMIKSVDDDGYIKLASMNMEEATYLAGRRVYIGNEKQITPGHFGLKPVHLGGVGGFDSMFIDIGAKDKEEAEKYAAPGDFAAYRSDFVVFGENDAKIKGKALSSRLGAAVLLSVWDRLHEENAELPCDIFFAFTCKSRIGASGAKTAAYLTSPESAVIVDCTNANDADSKTPVMKLGEGAGLSFADRGVVYDRGITDKIVSLADGSGIKLQYKKSISGRNDGAGVNLSGIGVKCANVTLPVRYRDTAAEVADIRDVESAADLLYLTAVKI